MIVPIQAIKVAELAAANLQLYIKREDLLHPHISGNKWRKLKYNLEAAKKQGYHTLLTFGGAFSNHVHATAAAGREYEFHTIGIIRGEEHLPLNSTLQFAAEQGMRLQYLSRADYRRKDDPEFIAQLRQTYRDFYLLPEGGTNVLAVKGCAEIVEGLPDFDYVCCSCGTGGTLAGIVAGLEGKSQVLGFSALKGGDFLQTEVDQLTKAYNGHLYSNYEIITKFHGGGYAKGTSELVDFINNFKQQSGIQLDPVYTGKMMYGIFSLAKEGFFRKDSAILAIHTGGLQGIAGFNMQHKRKNFHIFID